jgi:hypothetical protein
MTQQATFEAANQDSTLTYDPGRPPSPRRKPSSTRKER